MLSINNAVIVIALGLVTVYLYLTKHFHYWRSRKIPYKKPIFLFGNLYDVLIKGKPIASYLANLYHQFSGPYFGFFGMTEPFLVIKDPAIIKRILVTDFETFTEKTFINDESIDPIFSQVLFTQKKEEWNLLRTTLTPLFTSGKIKNMLPSIKKRCENMCSYLDRKLNQEIDVKEVAAKYATELLANLAFGIDINAILNENCEFREKGKKQFSAKFSRAVQPLAYVFAHPLVKLLRLKFIEPESATYYRHVFHETFQERKTSKVRKNDLIDTLLMHQLGSNSLQLSGDKLVAQAVIFYVAGNEGITNGIALTLLELAKYSNVQDRLRKEIQNIIALHGQLSYEAINDMKYLKMAVLETFRKYPFTAFVHRKCTSDYLIEETGLVIERGTKLLIPLQGLHNDPQYFPEPEKYEPERFSDHNKTTRPEYVYLPFGGGPRGCIANRFSLFTVHVGLAKILSTYKVELGPNVKYPLDFGVSFFLHSADKVSLIFRNL